MSGDIQRHARAFQVGTRGFVDEAFASWLQDPDGSRLFWLLAGPGMGKSVTMAHLRQQFDHQALFACHFCRHDIEERGEPVRMILSLAYQLAQQLPAYRGLLEAAKSRFEALRSETPEQVWDQVLSEALAELPEIGRAS